MQKVQNESQVVAFADHPTSRANAVQAQYQATEKQIDDAIRSATELLTELMSFQADMGLSATVGDRAISPAMQAIEGLRTVRGAVVASHKQSELISKAMGVRPSMTGWSKPQTGVLKEEDRAVS